MPFQFKGITMGDFLSAHSEEIYKCLVMLLKIVYWTCYGLNFVSSFKLYPIFLDFKKMLNL